MKTNKSIESLAVKSVRIGWPNGIAAAARLGGKAIIRQIQAQVWEDLCCQPQRAFAAIDNRDWAELCRVPTHHQVLGMTRQVMAQYQANSRSFAELYEIAKDRCFPLIPRAAGCFSAWLELPIWHAPDREIDRAPYRGIPEAMMDFHAHPRHGKTILSGTVDGHRRLADMVQSGGWEYVRGLAHEERI